MFNPYYARPIGSDKFLNHLLTLMTERQEIRNEEHEALPEIPVHPRAEFKPSTAYDPIMEGWKALDLAITAQAIQDYLDCYEKRIEYEDKHWIPTAYVWECRCLTLENEFFRIDPDRSALLDGVLNYVVHNPEDRYFRWRIDRIRSCKMALGHVIHPANAC